MLELIKDYVKMNQLVAATTFRAVFEHDCIVPDALPDMAKVLAVEGVAVVESTAPGNNSLTVNFRIHYKILYMTDEGEVGVRSFQSQSEHSAILDAPGIESGASCKINCCVENTEHTFVNSRKLSFRNMVRIEPRIENTLEQGITTGLSGLSDLQFLRSKYAVSNISESLNAQLTVSENLELPGGKTSFRELLRSDPQLSDVTYVLTGDKLQIRGNLTVCTLYLADDLQQSMQILENQIPFTQVMQVSALGESVIWEVDCLLKTFHAAAVEDADGEKRILSVEAVLTFQADSFETGEYEVLTDAYSLSTGFTMEKGELNTSLLVGELSTQFVLKEIAAKPEDAPGISEIVNVTGRIGQTDVKVEDGKVVIDGFVICNVLYISGDEGQPLASFIQQVPFSQVFDYRNASENMTAAMKLDVNHVSFSILSLQEIELRIAVSAKGILSACQTVPIIVSVSEPIDGEAQMPDWCAGWSGGRPSILLYVVQPGDTLWKIAKRYGAPMTLLQEVNELKNPDILTPGQKLLIPA